MADIKFEAPSIMHLAPGKSELNINLSVKIELVPGEMSAAVIRYANVTRSASWAGLSPVDLRASRELKARSRASAKSRATIVTKARSALRINTAGSRTQRAQLVNSAYKYRLLIIKEPIQFRHY